MNAVLFFILFSAEIIHDVCGKDDFDYCQVCKELPDMDDTWPCNLCKEGVKINHLQSISAKDIRSIAERMKEPQTDAPKTSHTTEENHDLKKWEDGRRTWLYTKIVIALILIITSAILCHCRYLRMKRMGAMVNDGDGNVQYFPAYNYSPHSFFQPSPQNMYLPTDPPVEQNPPSHDLYSISRSSYPPPPPGFTSTPMEASYTPPGFTSRPMEAFYAPPGFPSPRKTYPPSGYIPSISSYPQPLNPPADAPNSEPGPSLLPDNPYPLLKTPYPPPSAVCPQQIPDPPPNYTPIPPQVPYPTEVQQNPSLDSNLPGSQQASYSHAVDSEICHTNANKPESISVLKSDSTGK